MAVIKLNQLIDQIEAKPTDSLGKLYLYTALLDACTIEDSKSFSNRLPARKGKGLFNGLDRDKQNHLNVGSISYELENQVESFSKQFHTQNYQPLEAARTLFLAFFRRGKLTDLLTILNKMHEHLDDVREESMTKNKPIYHSFNFAHNQNLMIKELSQIRSMHQSVFSLIDYSGYALIATLVALMGLTLMLFSGLALVPLFIGTTLLVGGGVGVFLCACQIQTTLNSMISTIDSWTSEESIAEVLSVHAEQPDAQACHNLFFKALFASLSTMCKSLSFSQSMADAVDDIINPFVTSTVSI